MIVGFIIVPLVSLFTKKPDKGVLDKLFAPFCALDEAMEKASVGFLGSRSEIIVNGVDRSVSDSSENEDEAAFEHANDISEEK